MKKIKGNQIKKLADIFIKGDEYRVILTPKLCNKLKKEYLDNINSFYVISPKEIDIFKR